LFGWHALFVTVTGPGAVAVALLTVTRAVTGTCARFLQPAPAAAPGTAASAALTAGAVMIPFRVMSRREPALASG